MRYVLEFVAGAVFGSVAMAVLLLMASEEEGEDK